MNVSYDKLGFVGRLGNALYELAATAGIAHALEVEPRYNANWIHRPFFSVPDRFFTDDFTDCYPAHESHLARHIDERARIYLQDSNLFTEILPTIREWLSPSEQAKDILAEHDGIFRRLEGPVLSVHVRRGDNAPGGDPGTPDKHLYHPCPPAAYYEQAVLHLTKSGYEYVSMAVFSDDPDWCEEHLPFANYYHEGIGRPKEHEPDYLTAPVLDWVDFQLMVSADMHVCSNSTFGIMAAILAGDESAVVPWPIFGPRLKYIDASLLFPPSWARIPSGADRAS